MPAPMLLTHGPRAEWTVEQDFEGGWFAIGPQSQIVPGTVSGSKFTKAVVAAKNPVYLVTRVQRDLDILAGIWGLPDLQREYDSDTYCITKAGSTTSAIKILEPVLPNGTGTVEAIEILDVGINDNARPPYAVTSISGGDTINLTGAMSESAPDIGVLVKIIWKRKPRPDSGDFPNPSMGFKDGSGNWLVAETGTGKVWRASLSGSVLSKIASGSGTRYFDIGAVAGNGNIAPVNRPRGTWDFSMATIGTGSIPVAAVAGAVSTSGFGTTGGDLVACETPADAAAIIQPFPVGAIFISVDSTNPATTLGYGTWSAFATGRVLVGIDTGDADFHPVEQTAGAKTVAAAGSVAAPTISGNTADESAHTHSVTPNDSIDAHSTATVRNGTGTNQTVLTAPTSHTLTQPAVTSAAGSAHHHAAGSLAASAPAFTGSATSVVQPSIAVYMWKRTA